MIKQLFLNLSLPNWAFFIIFWILIFLAFRYYHKTLPPLSGSRRVLLTGIRSLILIIVVFLLLQPVLQFVYEYHEPPVVAVLLDNSGSMKIKDSYGMRGDSLQYVFQHLPDERNGDSLRLAVYKFSRSLQALGSDSLDFSGKQTNIARAVRGVNDSLAGQNLQAVVLLSDGQFNQGVNPLRDAATSAVPIHTVAIGDTVPQKDLRFTGVQANRVAYVGEEIPVSARIMQRGFRSGEMLVRLWREKEQIQAKSIKFPPEGFEQQVQFTLTADKPGEFRYTVEIVPQKGETTAQNNRSSFLLKVLKSKMRTLLISGQPTFDQRMVTFVLKQLSDVELSVLTEKSRGEYYEGGFQTVHPDSQDVFILLGFPTLQTNSDHLQRIMNSIRQRNTPFYLFITERTAPRKLSGWRDILPAEIPARLVPQPTTFAELTTGGKLHPVTSLEDDPQSLQALWTDLPPVLGLGRTFRLKEGSHLLIESASERQTNKMPLLIAGVRKDIKSLIFAAANIGGWHLQLQDDPRRDTFFQRFMERSLKWLVNREDIQRVQIHPSQKIYNMGEVIEFSGQVMNEFYRPVNDARVSITIRGEDFKQEDILVNEENYYRYQTSGISPGAYTYELTARKDGRVMGASRGKFVVQELELEMQETAANRTLMKEIAARSGGEVWSAREFMKKLNGFHFRKQIHLSTVEHVLWNKIYWLAALVVLLAGEWFFRKRWGLL